MSASWAVTVVHEVLTAQGVPTDPQDIAALAAIIAFSSGFVALGWAFLRKKRKERLEILAEASEEADREHDLQDYVDGKKLPASLEADKVPADDSKEAAAASTAARAELEAKRAEADEARARRERERLELQSEGEEAEEAAEAADAREKALAEARQREEEAKKAADEARARARQLRDALSKTREGIFGRISKAIGGASLDEDVLEDLESILYTSDIGARTAERLLGAVKEKLKAKEMADVDKVRAVLKQEIVTILSAFENKHLAEDAPPGPKVVMIVGVNGAGKTTTIGKLTHQLKGGGDGVVLGAGDTFRAAAVEQLAIWAERNDAPIVRGKEGADPASVLFDAVTRAKEEGAGFVLCDTAGRLHTKVNLMEELRKVHRVLGKAQEGAPHEVLLVLDATVGQNAIQQARQFGEAVPLTGIVLTKLDGTAKGGVIIGIADELKVPVRYIGVGEKLTDLRPFDADQFVGALFGEEPEVRSAA